MLDAMTLEHMGEGPILIALSGGGDSVALLHLLTECVGATRPRGVIVDHKLREGSGADAQRALQIAQDAGVAARVVELNWSGVANRAHEAARRARYAALCTAAREMGARVIVTGHTRDDQAETVLMRASRGSGLRGLAGMRAFAPAPAWPEGRGLWVARPLLQARRAELRDYLSARRLPWIEDPANENQVFGRVRARGLLAEMEEAGLDSMRFAALAERLRPLIDAVDAEASALIAEVATFDEGEIGVARLTGADLVKQRALEVLIMAASGEERGPTAAQVETIARDIDRPEFIGATVAGAWIARRGERLVIRRDPGALTGRADGVPPPMPLALEPGREAVWDGRVALTANETGWSVVFDGAPQLQRGQERRPLAAAAPQWLLRERVQHVLAVFAPEN